MNEVRTEETGGATLARDVAFILFKRKIPLIVLVIVGIAIIAIGTVTVEPYYVAEARVLVKRVQPGYEMPTESRAVLKRVEVVNSELQIIMSDAVAEEVVEKLDLARGGDRVLAVQRTKKRIRANSPTESDIIDITFKDRDPELAAAIVNTALDAYIGLRKDVALNYQAVEYLQRQASHVRAQMDSIAEEIARFSGARGQLSEGRKAQQHMGLIDGLENELLTKRAMIASGEAQIIMLEDWLAGENELGDVPTVEMYDMTTIRQAKMDIVSIGAELAHARAKFQPDHPEVLRLERQIAENERVLRQEVEQALLRQKLMLEHWKAEEAAFVRMIDEMHEEDSEISTEQMRIRLLERDLHISSTLYGQIMDRMGLYRVTAATDPSLMNVSVVSRASVPAEPAPQVVNMQVVVGVFTIIFGALLVFVLESMDHSLERREDVERHLNVKVLASVLERRG